MSKPKRKIKQKNKIKNPQETSALKMKANPNAAEQFHLIKNV